MLSNSVSLVASELDRIASVVIIMSASSDSMQSELLSKTLSFIPKVLSHRCLFYETTIGKVSLVRQLNPALHIEYDRSAYDQMKPFLKKMILIDSSHRPTEGDSLAMHSTPQHSAKRFCTVDSMADTLSVDWSVAK